MGEIPVLMPKMSMTMQEGTLLAWHKKPGDQVRSGETVCEVATDKVDMEVEAPADGTLSRILADPEEVVTVGTAIAYITSGDDDLLSGLLDTPTPGDIGHDDPGGRIDLPATGTQGTASSAPTAQRPAVPLARARAVALSVDLGTVTGSGPGGCIRVIDVEQAAAPRSVASPSAHQATRTSAAVRRQTARRATARRLAAGTTAPQLTLYADLDLDALEADRRGCRWTTLFVWAFAAALRQAPELNATWTDGRLTLLERVGVAVAVDTTGGMLAPVLHDPDLVTPALFDMRLRDLAAQARKGRLPLACLSGATGTLLNVGRLGIAAGQLPLIPPQATSLVIGEVSRHPVVEGDRVSVRTRCRAGLTVDQRVGDATEAARLLTRLNAILVDTDALHHGRRPTYG
ncbi:2-oxo acid dehydrogenase subunit E2 [Nonomuraea turcica]|uniref:2-oxo acid dehydrogenase subunit E2 n=1 Tax=Nonomuraea sp. G32 TaxID=3067274 RepID=UPI00273B72DC|nr:2-oxo acid dehydrogenase subunit E2 [Nonomuraea sp. G32]MDP4511985.1 2-oxo acid dehydrogenase subunit E2 [Nonomuraea sp. G32]